MAMALRRPGLAASIGLALALSLGGAGLLTLSHGPRPLLEFAAASQTGLSAECACTSVTGSQGEAVTFTRASSATCTKSDGTLVYCSADQPRIESIGGFTGIRIEGAATNYILRSQELDNAAWTAEGNIVAAPVVTADAAIAPDGTMSAESIAFPAVAGSTQEISQIKQAVTTASSVATCTGYLKTATPGDVYIWLYNGTTNYSARLSVTSSWARYSVSGTAASTSWTCHVGANAWGAAHSSVSAIAVQVWGMQIEPTAGATSYIPTTSATVTRANELARIPWPAGVTNTIGCISAYGYKGPWTGNSLPTIVGGQGNSMAAGFAASVNDLSGHDGNTAYTRSGLDSIVGRWEFVRLYWDTGGSIGGGNKIGFHVPPENSTDFVSPSYDGTLTAATLNIGSLDGTSRHWNGVVSRIVMNPTITGCPYP